MKSPRPTPTPTDVARALRNATSPAALLAYWQNRSIRRRLTETRARRQADWPLKKTLADARRALIATTPYYFNPENPCTVHVGERSPAIVNDWKYADQRGTSHKGWYMDRCTQDETIQGAAVELAQFPGIIFAATFESISDYYTLDLATSRPVTYEDQRGEVAHDLCLVMDDTARSMAEEECDYQEQFRAHVAAQEAHDEARATLENIRRNLRPLLSELRALRTLATDSPNACRALRSHIQTMMDQRAQAHETLAQPIPAQP